MAPSKNIRELEKREIIQIVPEKINIDNIKEPVFSLSGSFRSAKTAPLVELEIAFRRCKAGGVFKD